MRVTGLGVLLFLVLAFDVKSLMSAEGAHDPVRIRSIASFFETPPTDQIDTFRALSNEEKWQVYARGLRREPPTIYLATPFAEEGIRVVDLLKQELSSAKDNATIWRLLIVFEKMHNLRTYDTEIDKDLLRLVDARVQHMHEGPLKEDAHQIATEIASSGGT
jgi:hypothetical protein